ncbi:hypothetical protein F5Y01DRAFT_191401 [Xylaria sp. FL0043]|nr:hypothetical protein F5Y01DRAFT_191401 [Xylaria sp. FL0043]
MSPPGHAYQISLSDWCQESQVSTKYRPSHFVQCISTHVEVVQPRAPSPSWVGQWRGCQHSTVLFNWLVQVVEGPLCFFGLEGLAWRDCKDPWLRHFFCWESPRMSPPSTASTRGNLSILRTWDLTSPIGTTDSRERYLEVLAVENSLIFLHPSYPQLSPSSSSSPYDLSIPILRTRYEAALSRLVSVHTPASGICRFLN